MKVIELDENDCSLDEIVDLAQDELIVLRKPNGSVFTLSHVDDFAVEVELLKNNTELMTLLRKLSQEEAVITLEDLRQELGA